MAAYLQLLTGNFNFNLGKISFTPSYWQAGAMILLIFLLIMMMAQFRRHFLDWSFKGALFGLFWGFILALVLEGFLFISGRTMLIQLFGWKNPPKPIVNILDLGRNQLTKVLGTHN